MVSKVAVIGNCTAAALSAGPLIGVVCSSTGCCDGLGDLLEGIGDTTFMLLSSPCNIVADGGDPV